MEITGVDPRRAVPAPTSRWPRCASAPASRSRCTSASSTSPARSSVPPPTPGAVRRGRPVRCGAAAIGHARRRLARHLGVAGALRRCDRHRGGARATPAAPTGGRSALHLWCGLAPDQAGARSGGGRHGGALRRALRTVRTLVARGHRTMSLPTSPFLATTRIVNLIPAAPDPECGRGGRGRYAASSSTGCDANGSERRHEEVFEVVAHDALHLLVVEAAELCLRVLAGSRQALAVGGRTRTRWARSRPRRRRAARSPRGRRHDEMLPEDLARAPVQPACPRTSPCGPSGTRGPSCAAGRAATPCPARRSTARRFGNRPKKLCRISPAVISIAGRSPQYMTHWKASKSEARCRGPPTSRRRTSGSPCCPGGPRGACRRRSRCSRSGRTPGRPAGDRRTGCRARRGRGRTWSGSWSLSHDDL